MKPLFAFFARGNNMALAFAMAMAMAIAVLLLCLWLASGTRQLEGMTGQTDGLESLKKETELMQTTYAELKSGIEDQKNRIENNAQMTLKVMSDAPNKSSEVTGVSVNPDDPSKTAIPKVNMS
jgi:uncharacterized protein YlxW (UPF0749 family)